jgi:hypothetical protein
MPMPPPSALGKYLTCGASFSRVYRLSWITWEGL